MKLGDVVTASYLGRTMACKILEVAISAREGDAVYRTSLVTKVLSSSWTPPGTVVAGGGRSSGAAGFYRSPDLGATWGLVQAGSASLNVALDGMEAANGDLFLTTGSDFVGRKGEVWRSQDQGETWERVFQHASERYVWSIAQADDESLVVGTATTGEFWRSANGGDDWAKVGQTAATRYVKRIVRAGNGDLLAGCGRFNTLPEVYRSQDDGQTWALRQVLATGSNGYVESMLRLGNGVLLLGTSYLSAQVWRSLNDGSSWSSVATLAGENYCYALAQTATGAVLAGSGHNCKAWRSPDNGQTWIDAGTLNAAGSAVYWLEPLVSGDVLAGTDVDNDGAEVWRSEDDGFVWTKLSVPGEDEGQVRVLVEVTA